MVNAYLFSDKSDSDSEGQWDLWEKWRWQESLIWSLKCSSNCILRYGQYVDTIIGMLCTAPLQLGWLLKSSFLGPLWTNQSIVFKNV